MGKSGCLSVMACLALVACSEPQEDDEESEVLAATESYKEFGEYVVHFNAVMTNSLTENIAREYDIVRSNSRALLNISILQNQEIGLASSVAGQVRASARNLTGQLRNLDVREIREGEAIYFIAETPVVNGETLIFSVEAVPETTTEPLRVEFQKQFFVNQ